MIATTLPIPPATAAAARPESTGRPPTGKAAVLAELQRAGFPVPRFFHSPHDLAGAVSALGFPLVVRSSASAEDGAEASFAGQFESTLDLWSVEAVEAAVDACRDSLQAPAVREYCRVRGLAAEASLEMGFIVQRMVQPELAGVAFSVDPATGAEEVVIEAVAGIADRLLAGQESPLPPDHPLLRRHRGAIEAALRQVQRHFGTPQDVEFAIEDGDLFILQARPVTRVQFPPSTGQWTNAEFRDGGVSSGVCTPMMWSLYEFVWGPALNGFLRDIRLLERGGDFPAGRLFFGRPYWNVGEVKRCLAKLPGFVERDFDRDVGLRPRYEGAGQVTLATPLALLKAVPAGLAIEHAWRRQRRVDHALLEGGFERLTAGYREAPPAWEEACRERLRSLVEEVYATVEGEYFRTIFCASLARLDFVDAFPDADLNALAGGLPGLSHLEPLTALAEAGRAGGGDADEAVAALLDRFGHHSRRELDISVPRWDEDPGWVAQLIESCRVGDGGTRREDGAAAIREAYERARASARAGLRWHPRRAFDRKLQRVREFHWLREQMRDLSSRTYQLIRRHVLALARERDLGDDVFFMSFQDLLADDRSRVERGRETYEGYRSFNAPVEIGGRPSEGGSRDPGRAARAAGDPVSVLHGLPVSQGTVAGVARVALTIEEALRVEPGAVLVCPYTDPGWTPVLSRVGGVVTETGGSLSHAAIICREFGLPALLNVEDATRLVPDGARVTLDAGCGRLVVGGESE